MKLCKWCSWIRKQSGKNNANHSRCKGNNDCECKCRDKEPMKLWQSSHVVNMPPGSFLNE